MGQGEGEKRGVERLSALVTSWALSLEFQSRFNSGCWEAQVARIRKDQSYRA